MDYSFDVVEEQVSLEISGGEHTRDRLANHTKILVRQCPGTNENGEHLARRWLSCLMFRHKVDVVLMSFVGRCYVNVSVRPIAAAGNVRYLHYREAFIRTLTGAVSERLKVRLLTAHRYHLQVPQQI